MGNKYTTKNENSFLKELKIKEENDMIFNLEVEKFDEYLESILPTDIPNDIREHIIGLLKFCKNSNRRKKDDADQGLKDEVSFQNNHTYYIVYFSKLSKDGKFIDFAFKLKYSKANINKAKTLTLKNGKLIDTNYKNEDHSEYVKELIGSKLLEEEKQEFKKKLELEYDKELLLLKDS